MSQILKQSDFYHHPTLPQISCLQGNCRMPVTPIINSGLLCAIPSVSHGGGWGSLLKGSMWSGHPAPSASVEASAASSFIGRILWEWERWVDDSAQLKWPKCLWIFIFALLKTISGSEIYVYHYLERGWKDYSKKASLPCLLTISFFPDHILLPVFHVFAFVFSGFVIYMHGYVPDG